MAAPKLRFKEFDGDLTESKLVELTLWASGGTPAKDIPEYWGDDIPLISGASMHTNQLYESDVKITRLGLQKGSKLAPKDSILILVRGSMLFNKIPMGITLGDVAFNQDVKCIRPKQELAPQFLFQWLHAKENTIQNKVTATGIGAGKLDTADLQNLKLYKPSSEEQTKIASFLSNVDEKISQLTQKHQLLSQYKQGMMQKLFSQEIRFKADDGSEFGEWEETELGKHCQIKTGKLDANAMRPNGEFRFYTCAKEFYLIDEYAFDTEALLISGNGANVGYIHYYKGKFNAYQRTYVLDQWQQNIIFIQYFLEQFLKERIYGEKKEGNTPYIVLSTLSEMPLLLPCLEEQTKIANFLSAIDQKIEVVAQQIEQAKTWKKGLLQQMFI
ncbi:restriction endonuclease S subunits-like protein [Acinetobacter baumannii]|nr:restriction endonuclease subunit S [Acinetobacter baumannii]EXA87794.1 type I restriction modification DNA specificity domain protein [Acinetobacter baumannii 118362]MBD0496209.1 restriction endonuclease subunit S [Acinetobacter baumannii]MCG6652074.1 restriction endonuclease subunit S [Acinetobacter baumannii]MCW8534802.1 restriction endonuclease subunit S [Acinetobacter baumannii]MCW8538472.1 restriction endonuclease subunit S [Acinetobacter baumannii]